MALPFRDIPARRRARVAAISLASACLLPAIAHGAPELFRPAPSSGVLNDAPATAPALGETNGISYEVIQGLAVTQGDIILGKHGDDLELTVPIQTRALGQTQLFERWRDGVIPYRFAGDITASHRETIMIAVQHWNDNTRILMVDADSLDAEGAARYPDYIEFQVGAGCASYVGKQSSSDRQAVWADYSCATGSIIHEIGHAIGLFHEHTRNDRDNFIQILEDNVITDRLYNFDKVGAGGTSVTDYDYGSIMHYGVDFWTSNGQPTLRAPDGVVVGQRVALSPHDISGVNSMYATDLGIAASTELADELMNIDVVVNNLGALGATQLVLTATLGDTASWQSITANSGWNCQQRAEALECARATLDSGAASVFTIQVLPNGASADDLQMSIDARTLDVDYRNNGINQIVTAADSTSDNNTESDNAPENGEPDIGAATDGSADGGTDGTTETGAGAAWYLLIAAAAGICRRRRSSLSRH